MIAEIENGLIYCCINNGDAFLEASSKVSSKHFSSSVNQILWNILIELSEEGLAFDEPIIKSRLQEREKEFFDSYIKWQTVDTTNYEYYINSLISNYKLSKIKDIGIRISDYGNNHDFKDTLNFAEQKILEVAEDSVDSEIQPMGLLLGKFYDKIKAGREAGVSTTIDRLNELTNGFLPGQLIVIAGRPSMGKSAFALQIAYHNALRNKVPFGVFSLEMSQEDMLERMIANIGDVESWKVRNGKLSDFDWTKLRKFKDEFNDSPFYMEDMYSVDISTLRAKAKKLKMKHKDLGGIVIDYMQLMESGASEGNRVQAVSDISRGLKVLAKELHTPVIAVSQLNRAVEQREDKKPILADLRESGAIEQDADVVIFLYREDYYKGEQTEESLLDITIAKQRNGPLGTVKTVFKKQFQRIIGITSV